MLAGSSKGWRQVKGTVGRWTALLGVVAWVVVTSVTSLILPPEPGPFSERPFAKALLAGGSVGMPLIALDLSRRPRRWWVWGLGAWGGFLMLSARSGAFGDDSDIDQIIGWGVFLGAVIAIPLILVSLVGWLWNRGRDAVDKRHRRWRAEVQGDSIEIARKAERS